MPYAVFFIALCLVVLFGLWSKQKNQKAYQKQSEKEKNHKQKKVKRASNHLRRVK